jgi:2-keto-4-pentenoate hydratase/2-oxohepta-3-ene-1,7-dioic acid hydratase in catechol pathway
MKLLRVGAPGAERPAVVSEAGHMYDASSVTSDYNGRFFAENGLSLLRQALSEHRLPVIDSDLRIGTPVAKPGKIVCIGLNYVDHATEAGLEAPNEPVVFLKAPETAVGARDTVLVPRGSSQTDYEVELAVVIGTRVRYLDLPRSAGDYIAGYCVTNDMSEREFQNDRGGQWTKGKSCETFNPLGPYLVTRDEIANPQDLRLRLWVNGELRQDGTTADMIFSVDHLIWYLSQFMTLEPGDVINTGTPAGVGMGMKPPRYLTAGDVIETEITGLGRHKSILEQA